VTDSTPPSPPPPARLPGPAVIGHRGVPAERPENTMSGFVRALELRVDGIELDVHATRDGVLVVHHDEVVRSIDAEGGTIARLRWAQLAESSVPALEAVLDLVGDRATVYVEVKGRGIEREVAAAVAHAPARCAVHSFDHRTVAALRDLQPGVPRGILQTSRLVDSVAALRAAGAVTLWQHWQLVDEALVREVAAVGGEVIAWTVNDPALANRFAEWGVAGICTDDPARVTAALSRR
jgi:glycerophosphoryl diester phosphodiesterase